MEDNARVSREFNPSTHGGMIDKLRHNDHGVERMLRGVGSRAKQYEVLKERGIISKEGKLPRKNTSQNPKLSDEQRIDKPLSITMTTEEIKRFDQAKGGKSRREFVLGLMDGGAEAKVAAIYEDLRAVFDGQKKIYGLSTDAQVMDRLVEAADKSRARATKIMELQTRVEELVHQVDALSTTPATPANAAAEECLFDFVDLMVGARVTLGTSGDLEVEIEPAKLGRMFSVWQRAVSALNIKGGK